MFTSSFTPIQEDLTFVYEIMLSNEKYFTTKVKVDNLDDIFSKILYSLIGKEITSKGIFIPSNDLKILIEDKDRIDKFKQLGYPIELNSVEDILVFLENNRSTINFQTLEKVIKTRWTKKKLNEIAYKLNEDTVNSTKTPEEILRKYSTALDDLMFGSDDEREICVAQDIYTSECNYLNSPSEMFYKTGAIIDNENGGLGVPSLTIYVAGPKVGKSMMLYNSALMSLKEGRKVLFVTIEIGADECKRKILSNYAQMEFSKINKKELTEEEKLWYLNKCKEFGDLYEDKFFIYYNKSGVCCKDIEIYWNNLLKAGIQIDDIFIDYLYIMKSNISNIPQVEALGNLPKELRILSQKTNTRVSSAQQLNSASETKSIDKITFDDIYYMKNLAFEATYTIALKNEIESGSILAKCLPSRQKWSNTIYYYPDINKDKLTLGIAEEWDDSVIKNENNFF